MELELRPVVEVAGVETPTFSVPERLARYRVPGLSLAVIDSGEVAWSRSWGNASAEQSLDTGTLFPAGSLSMTTVAVATLQRVEQGELELRERVDAPLESFRLPEHDYDREATLEWVLAHIAGLSLEKMPRGAMAQASSLLEQLESGLRVEQRPGVRYRLSEGGYALLQLVLEQTAREPDFAALMTRSVLDPAEMSDSIFSRDVPGGRSTARGHGFVGEELPDSGRTAALAVDGLWTHPSDFARLIAALQRSLAAGAEGGLLGSRWVERMLRGGLRQHGIGVELVDAPGAERLLVVSDGDGYRCVALGYLEPLQGAVVFANGAGSERLIEEVLLALAREYDWAGIAPLRVDPKEGGVGSPIDLVGQYRLDDTTILRVTMVDGVLTLAAPAELFPGEGELEAALYPLGSAYLMVDRPERITFEWEGGEPARALFLEGRRAERIAGDDSVTAPID